MRRDEFYVKLNNKIKIYPLFFSVLLSSPFHFSLALFISFPLFSSHFFRLNAGLKNAEAGRMLGSVSDRLNLLQSRAFVQHIAVCGFFGHWLFGHCVDHALGILFFFYGFC